jgi:hypothetical protein
MELSVNTIAISSKLDLARHIIPCCDLTGETGSVSSLPFSNRNGLVVTQVKGAPGVVGVESVDLEKISDAGLTPPHTD